MKQLKAYLAGPDVFLPDAAGNAAAKITICAQHGIIGRAPLNDDAEALAALDDAATWRLIYRQNIAMMETCDIVIANLTPFRGASADAGTLIEVGWFLGRGKPVFGYSNTADLFDARSRQQVAAMADPLPGLAIEGFGLPDNLMIAGAVSYGGAQPITLPPDGINRAFDALEMFTLCVAGAAKQALLFYKKAAKNF